MDQVNVVQHLQSIEEESIKKIDNSLQLNGDSTPADADGTSKQLSVESTGTEVLYGTQSPTENTSIKKTNLDSVDETSISKQESVPHDNEDSKSYYEDSNSNVVDAERSLSEVADSFYSVAEIPSNIKSPNDKNSSLPLDNPFEKDDDTEEKDETLAQKFEDVVENVGDFISNIFGNNSAEKSAPTNSEPSKLKSPQALQPKPKFIDDNASETSTLYAVSEIHSEDYSTGHGRHAVEDLDPAALAAERARIEELQKILEPGAVLKKASSFNPALRKNRSAKDIERAKDAQTLIEKSLVSSHIKKFKDIESKSIKSFDRASNPIQKTNTSYGGNVAQYIYSQRAAPKPQEFKKPQIRVSGHSAFKLPTVSNDIPFTVIQRGKSVESFHHQSQVVKSRPAQEWINRSKNLEEHTYTSDMINAAARMNEIDQEKERQDEYERERRTRSLPVNEAEKNLNETRSKSDLLDEVVRVNGTLEPTPEAPDEDDEVLPDTIETADNPAPSLEQSESSDVKDLESDKPNDANPTPVDIQTDVESKQINPEESVIDSTHVDTTESPESEQIRLEPVEEKIESNIQKSAEAASPELRMEQKDLSLKDQDTEQEDKHDLHISQEVDKVLFSVDESKPSSPPAVSTRFASETENETVVDKGSPDDSQHHSSDETETIVDSDPKKEIMDIKKGSDDGIKTPEANEIVKDVNVAEDKKEVVSTHKPDDDVEVEGKSVRKSRKMKKSKYQSDYVKATGGCCTIS